MRVPRSWPHVGIGVVIGAFGLAAVGGVGYAAPAALGKIPNGDDEIKLCYDKSEANNKSGGAVLSIFNPSRNEKRCAAGEKVLEIDAQGERGRRGPQGEQGKQGEQGDDGAPVPNQLFDSGFVTELIDSDGTDIFFPSGPISASTPNPAYASTPFAIRISDFVMTLPDSPDGTPSRMYVLRTFNADLTPSGGITCTIPAEAAGDTIRDSCAPTAAFFTVTPDRFYAFEVVTDDLPAGSSFEYLITRVPTPLSA